MFRDYKEEILKNLKISLQPKLLHLGTLEMLIIYMFESFRKLSCIIIYVFQL